MQHACLPFSNLPSTPDDDGMLLAPILENMVNSDAALCARLTGRIHLSQPVCQGFC